MLASARARLRALYLGWWVVVGAMGLQMLQAALLSQAFGLYVVVWTEAFAWSRTAVAGGFALIQLVGGLAAPPQGAALDRFGPRRVTAVGVVVFGGGLVTLSTITTLVGYYAALTLVALGIAMTGYLSSTTAIAPWFLRRRATAMAWMAVGASVGGLLVPIVAGAIVAVGWRPTLLASGVLLVLAGMPFAALLRREPGRYGQAVDGGYRGLPDAARGAVDLRERDPAHDFTLAQALRTRAFWMLGLGHGAALLVVSAVVVHLVPHLNEGLGLSLTAAASVVAALTLVTAVAQLLGGALGDRVRKRRLAEWAMYAHALGLLALAWLPPVVGVGAFLLLHGLAWGVRGPLMGAMRADYFGTTNFGAILGASTLVFMAGQLLGPITAGVMADAFGDYRAGFTLLAVLASFGSLAFRLATPPRPPTGGRRPPAGGRGGSAPGEAPVPAAQASAGAHSPAAREG